MVNKHGEETCAKGSARLPEALSRGGLGNPGSDEQAGAGAGAGLETPLQGRRGRDKATTPSVLQPLGRSHPPLLGFVWGYSKSVGKLSPPEAQGLA